MKVVYRKSADRKPVVVSGRSTSQSLAMRLAKEDREWNAEQALDRARDRVRVAGVHSWTAATVLSIARPIVAIQWDVVPIRTDIDVDIDDVEPIRSFFEDRYKDYVHVRDYITTGSKLMYTAANLKLHGQAAWEILYDDDGVPTGFDVIPGYIVPNVDDDGYLESPAFTAHLWTGGQVEYEVGDIVYFVMPWREGAPWGDSEYDALLDVVIPADIHAGISYREIFENINAPYNGVWEVDPNVSDEDFEFFLNLLDERYTGSRNYGRNIVAIRGTVNWKPTASLSDEDAPYLGGREFSRDEVASVTGVNTNKLGITANATKANMRESRRDFFEAAQGPILRVMEEVITDQVIWRLFGEDRLCFKFRQPDFLNALERATVNMREIQTGVISPNEARAQKGMPPRDGGDVYVDPTQGRAPSRVAGDGESDIPEPERPPRDEEDTSKDVLRELRQWMRFEKRIRQGKRAKRKFFVRHVPRPIAELIEDRIDGVEDPEIVEEVFRQIMDAVEKGYEYECD